MRGSGQVNAAHGVFLGAILTTLALQAQHTRETPIPPQPATTANTISQGQRLFQGHCGACHGPEGRGALAPNLARPDLRHITDAESIFLVIDQGIEGTEMPASRRLQDSEIWKIVAYVESIAQDEAEEAPGDSAAGQGIYMGKGNCATCHWLRESSSGRGSGGRSGPELSRVGSRSLTHLRQALLDPGASVPEDYLLISVVKRDGRRIEGVRLNEDVFTIQIRDFADEIHSLNKREIVELTHRRQETSMPSYRDRLTDAEVDDLVAYLATLKGP